MEQNSSFIFDVHIANGSWEIEDIDDLESFFDELAGFSFLPPQHETANSSGKGDLYVFSTACDTGLNGFILANNQRPINLFLIQPINKNYFTRTSNQRFGGGTEVKSREEKDIEILKISDFSLKGCYPSARWLTNEKIKPLNVNTEKIETFSAGVKL